MTARQPGVRPMHPRLGWQACAMRGLFAILLLSSGVSSGEVEVPASEQIAFSIPEQPLATALIAFSQQSGVQVLMSGTTLQSVKAPAVVGSFTASDALARLLEGTASAARFTNAQTVVIERRPESTRPPPRRPSGARRPHDVEPERLTEVTVLGSMLPRAQVETSNALIVLTSADIRERGYSSVADALQDATFNTGANLNQSTHYFDSGIWGAKIVGMFGLPPSYTKFLIDGRPVPKHPNPALRTSSLYGSVPITNLTSIPLDLVDRIEVLPGGHSSLYGSDAIAGVINIVLKKRADEAILTSRYGIYSDGGGRERSASFIDAFGNGRARVMFGVQVSDQEPIWAFQRDPRYWDYINSESYLPERGLPLIRRYVDGELNVPDRAACAPASALWGGSVQYYGASDGRGYCGSKDVPSFHVLTNRVKTASVSVHATFEITEKLSVYSDLLGNDEQQARPSFDQDGFFARYFDPNLGETVVVWRDFAPEEVADSLDESLTTTNREKWYLATVGGRGGTDSGWTYDVSMSRSAKSLVTRQVRLLRNSVAGSYASYFLGPRLGTADDGLGVHAADYTRLYSAVTPDQFRQFNGLGVFRGHTRNDLMRVQMTQDQWLSLPGGEAGLGVVLESGSEYWSYGPDRNESLAGAAFEQAVDSGHADQLAAGAEVRLPFVDALSVDLSARYDRNNAEGSVLDDVTYSVATEYRPFETLLLRGKFGTAFKAPSLPDRLIAAQGEVGNVFIFDYLQCSQAGYGGTPQEIRATCPYELAYATATEIETLNPNLDSTKARTLSYGIVWSPLQRMAVHLDYQQVAINDEVQIEYPDYLLQMEYLCSTGTFDSRSRQCRSAQDHVRRDAAPPGSAQSGAVSTIETSKINLAKEWNRSIRFGFQYTFEPGRYGEFGIDADYTKVLHHELQTFPQIPRIDLRRTPSYNTDFGNKANLSIAWSREAWSVMLHCRYYGSTPNATAGLNDGYDAEGAGKLPPWRVYNAGISYSPSSTASFSLRVNNLRNAMPPAERYSNFNARNYNPFGREVLFEASYRFGRR